MRKKMPQQQKLSSLLMLIMILMLIWWVLLVVMRRRQVQWSNSIFFKLLSRFQWSYDSGMGTSTVGMKYSLCMHQNIYRFLSNQWNYASQNSVWNLWLVRFCRWGRRGLWCRLWQTCEQCCKCSLLLLLFHLHLNSPKSGGNNTIAAHSGVQLVWCLWQILMYENNVIKFYNRFFMNCWCYKVLVANFWFFDDYHCCSNCSSVFVFYCLGFSFLFVLLTVMLSIGMFVVLLLGYWSILQMT